MKVGRFTQLAAFDSATAMVAALSKSLKGKGFAFVGAFPSWTESLVAPLSSLVNGIPSKLREKIFVGAGRSESMPADKLDRADIEEICRWVTQQYPKRQYPAVAIGSSNGAAVHLCAALGIPWLPQTFLVPVARTGIAPDDGQKELAWGARVASGLLNRNPGIHLHHMQDPVQDRLMVRAMSYFRIKKLQLGAAYETFLKTILAPNGVIIVFECKKSWPVVRVNDHHYFQFGAVGGPSPEEYYFGSERIRAFLSQQKTPPSSWLPPKPDLTAPEAEWGFESTLIHDLKKFSSVNGWPLKRVAFEEPEDLSDLTTEFYRWWLGKQGQASNRLLVESFILIDPQWILQSGTVPYWTVFGIQSSLNRVLKYLGQMAEKPAFEEIFAFLFPHGVQSVGLASVSEWKKLVEFARLSFRFVGVDEKAYPCDFGAFLRYHRDLWRSTPILDRPTDSVHLNTMLSFIHERGNQYRVLLQDDAEVNWATAKRLSD